MTKDPLYERIDVASFGAECREEVYAVFDGVPEEPIFELRVRLWANADVLLLRSSNASVVRRERMVVGLVRLAELGLQPADGEANFLGYRWPDETLVQFLKPLGRGDLVAALAAAQGEPATR